MSAVQNSTNSDIFFSKNADRNKDHVVIKSMVHTAQMHENSLWPKFMSALNFWFEVPDDTLEKINDIVRVAQVARHLLDDVAENAQVRKGAPTAPSLYSAPDSMNSAYYACFVVLEKLRGFKNFDAVLLGSKYFKDWSKGQGLEVYWRDNVICPTEEEYMKMGVFKTGSLIEFTIKLMQMFSENKSNFDELIKILSRFFHIYDDYVCLKALDEYFLNKNGCDLVSEGKFSFPAVHAMWTHPDDVQLINMLRQKSREQEVINYFVKLTGKFGGFDYTIEALKKLKKEAEQEMKKLGKNPDLVRIFEDISSKLKLN